MVVVAVSRRSYVGGGMWWLWRCLGGHMLVVVCGGCGGV